MVSSLRFPKLGNASAEGAEKISDELDRFCTQTLVEQGHFVLVQLLKVGDEVVDVEDVKLALYRGELALV